MSKVYIVNTSQAYRSMFEDNGWDVVFDLHEADLVQFTGGEDVTPSLYGDVHHPQTYNNRRRDEAEQALYEAAKAINLPCAGICRGAQFLHVMSGGKLWQHVDNHGVYQGHTAFDEVAGKELIVSSTHHQMLRDDGVGEVLMVAYESDEKHSGTDKHMHDSDVFGRDIEAVLHKELNNLCYQPHPEFFTKDSDCQRTYFKYLEMLLWN